MPNLLSRDRLINFACIILSILLITVLHKAARFTDVSLPLVVLINVVLIPAAGYAFYFFLGRKFTKLTDPVLWIIAITVFDIVMSLNHVSNIRFIVRAATISWLICMVVYFIEWLMNSKTELVSRRLEFRNLVFIAILFFIIYASIDSYLTFTTTTHGSSMTFIAIFFLFGGYKLLNATGGISDRKCRRDLGASRQGDKYITYFQELTGDEAVLFGIRSAMIWLSIGALWVNISPFIK